MSSDSLDQAVRDIANELYIDEIDITSTRRNEGIDSELLKMRVALLEMRLLELDRLFDACHEVVQTREAAYRTLFKLQDELAPKANASK